MIGYILITAPYKVLVLVDFNTNVYPDLLNFIFSDNFSHFDFLLTSVPMRIINETGN